ncbi:MAG: hydrolase 1, exosortase A system-associated [Sphingopyxis sp.]
MRRALTFDVAGAACAATLDEAAGTRGLLIVSGGNEIRAGAHRGMARLAAIVAADGYPVLRFDRRGIGDSEGNNGGFEASGPDIAAAVSLFRRECPHLSRISAFGNCDGASALALHHAGAGIDALILANPWTIDAQCSDGAPDDTPALPPAAAIRARYAAKLKDPREWWRLVSGGVNVRKLARGLSAVRAATPSQLAARVASGIAAFGGQVRILVASRDGTAQAFIAAWDSPTFEKSWDSAVLLAFDTASHSFSDDAARDWFDTQLLDAMKRNYSH